MQDTHNSQLTTRNAQRTTHNILVDGRWAGDTGIGRMYQEIISRKPADIEIEHVQEQFPLGSLWSPIKLAQEIKKATDCRLFYSPSFMPPLSSSVPYIITIHDLMHLFYYSWAHKLYYKQVISRLAKKAKYVITVSHFSKQQLVELLGLDADRIKVIYNGVDKRFFEEESTFSLVGRPYFLYIGNRRKNKNIQNMLEGFAKANIPNDFVFALSGHSDAELHQLIHRLGIVDRVKFLGFVEEKDLASVYKGAFATCYVSLMEGFGLPILESMAAGTPVITSNVSSLPEVAAGAALEVDPHKPAAISEAMERLVADDGLLQRLTAKGKVRAREFDWEDTAAQTWELIRSCL
ncbi:glycosyltransferase family 4 protein [Olivibacter sitiensis]|uniref:glycosyltransferase family 4 protein n=1 Tax=Olivibacter sitiensis TaxID=376470 RepID=UPI0004196755|nr:glycosyltransferase family 1 protein [Olivibacter sitiensis]